MMVTMPGLPMFGHGQIEGFAEKYGMEYRRAYWNEQPDVGLIERHQRQIFPLLRRRYLFAEVENFLLYDFISSEGYLNEDVFAYSNRVGNERVLVVYHNRYAEARGWIYSSVRYLSKREGCGQGEFVQKSLGEGLGLRRSKDWFVLFRDQITGLEYIRNSAELHDKGLYIELGAYQCHIFLEFREVQDDDRQSYRRLHDALRGQGTYDIQEALRQVILKSIHEPLRRILNADSLRFLLSECKEKDVFDSTIVEDTGKRISDFLWAVVDYTQTKVDIGRIDDISKRTSRKLWTILRLPNLLDRYRVKGSRDYLSAVKFATSFKDYERTESVLICWALIHLIGRIRDDYDSNLITRSWMDEWQLGKVIAETLQGLSEGDVFIEKGIRLIKILTLHQDWYEVEATQGESVRKIFESLLQDEEVRNYLHVHRFQDVLWFNKEAFEEFLWWLFTESIVNVASDERLPPEQIGQKIVRNFRIIKKIRQAGEKSGYQVEKLLEIVK